ncbi:MAG: hypothetical protein KGP35_02045 [Bacteroidetes bacterium]|nr:hypothetical protein [Bacteroidota bacterium]
MYRLSYLFLTLVFALNTADAQSISELQVSSTETGKGKLRKAPKKVYIADFKVCYQVLYVAQEKKKARVYSDMIQSATDAKISMGLQGISEADLVSNTDYLYNHVVQKLTAAGYQIVTPDEMAGIKEFKGWERKKGGGLSNVQFEGFLMSTPTNFEYFIKGTKEDGREKNTFTDNSAKISYQGDNVSVLKISLVVPMAEDGESYMSAAFDLGGAKVVGQTALKLSKRGVSGKGISNALGTNCSFVNSEAMGLPTSICQYSLKEDLDIEGVLEKTKVKAVAVANISWGVSAGLFKYFEVENSFMEKVTAIPVDPEKYNKGVRMACKAFVDYGIDDFLKNAN